jgi:hypothetical protein
VKSDLDRVAGGGWLARTGECETQRPADGFTQREPIELVNHEVAAFQFDRLAVAARADPDPFPFKILADFVVAIAPGTGKALGAIRRGPEKGLHGGELGAEAGLPDDGQRPLAGQTRQTFSETEVHE